MERFLCIHGHFYQPPRENPWLESIELQDSAYPYHDWNERITAECYEPNAASRILDGEGRIRKIVNNYARISFNFGPTLLAWLEDKQPELYAQILHADRESQELFSGHGSALAQCYNHMIMPLAGRRDKETQVRWGIVDFERRFGRRPEGMWLPETAVDLETLEILAEQDIRFTILAPSQAARVRKKKGGRKWHDVAGGHIDPTTPYEIQLPSGRTLALFFYDGPISRGIAFERLLFRGEDFAHRLISAFSDARAWPQLVHIATDGETYGHHHPYGNMALSYALEHIEQNRLARITNYGEFLEKHPPGQYVEIFENTAWSCAHGVGRWESDCGCNSGGHAGWNQAWRGPLREALDWLRDELSPLYEAAARELLADPWKARDEYVSVVLDRSPENVERFFAEHARRPLQPEEQITALKLLELQRHAMLMYTSCGWFFDELSGIETVQVIHYAGRAVQLAQILFGDSLEEQFLERLERARSNIPEHGDGRRIYERWVKPAAIDLSNVAAHYAASSLFEEYEEDTGIFCYQVDRRDYQRLEAGRVSLALGRVVVKSEITHAMAEVTFACLHLGDHNLTGGVRPFTAEAEYRAMIDEIAAPFRTADFPETLRCIDRHFHHATYSLKTLFRDEQRKILDQILESTLQETESAYRHVFQNHAPLMRFMAELGVPIPTALRTAAEVILNADLRRELSSDEPDLGSIRALCDEAAAWQAQLDHAGLGYIVTQQLARFSETLREELRDVSELERLEMGTDLAHSLPFEVDLSKAQNVFYNLLQRVLPRLQEEAAQGNEGARSWLDRCRSLGVKLSIRVKA